MHRAFSHPQSSRRAGMSISLSMPSPPREVSLSWNEAPTPAKKNKTQEDNFFPRVLKPSKIADLKQVLGCSKTWKELYHPGAEDPITTERLGPLIQQSKEEVKCSIFYSLASLSFWEDRSWLTWLHTALFYSCL